MAEWQNIPVNLGQGIDSKTDQKLVVSGKLLELENAVFTKVKSIEKRNGYTNIPGLVAPQLIHSYKDELIAADQNQIKSYSPTGGNWVSRGPYTSVELTQTTVDQEHPTSGHVDCAVLGNYALYGWATTTDLGSTTSPVTQVFASIVDLTTGAVIYGPTSQNTASNNSYLQPVKCVVLGGSTLAILYLDNPGSKIAIRTVSIAAGVATFSAATDINFTSADVRFDVVGTTVGGILTYIEAGVGLRVAQLNSSGASVATASFAGAGYCAPIHVNTGPGAGGVNSPNIWVYFANHTGLFNTPTASSIYYLVLDYSLATIVAPTLVVSLPAFSAGNYFIASNITSVLNPNNTQNVYYGYYSQAGTTSSFSDICYTTNVTVGGAAGSSDLFAIGVTPYSRSFSITQFGQTKRYAVFAYRGYGPPSGFGGTTNSPFNAFQKTQPTLFMVTLGTIYPVIPSVVARFAAGLENIQSLMNPYISGGAGVISYVPNAVPISSLKVLFPYAKNIQEFHSDIYSNFGVGSTLGALSSSYASVFDFGSENSYIAKNVGGMSVLNGSLLQAYDGQVSSELGYHLAPEIIELVASNTAPVAPGAGIAPVGANNSYSYLAVFQWTDAQGNLHQSESSVSLSINITQASGFNTVDIWVTGSYLSQKTGVSVAIYRTQSNGTVYSLVTNPVYLKSVDNVSAATFRDQLSDAELAGNLQPYTFPGSSVLENSAPPPSMAMVPHNNRLWFVDSENPNTIWYTKSVQPLMGISPSAFLTEQIDEKLGNISALAEMDEKLVIFKQAGIFIQSGDGANDTGTGSTLSFPQFVPSDVGCSELKSPVLTPSGVMFKSINGIYILDRSTSVSYLGAPVEQYNSQTITDSRIIPGKSQIRFLCSGGLTLVYDYIFQQWSTFTNHTGLSATNWKNQYVYATTGGLIFKENPGYYLDNLTALNVKLKTSWLNLAGVQGFERVRRLLLLGDFVNGASALHAVQITALYDFSLSAAGPTIPYVFGVASDNGVLQYRERLSTQKCDTISLVIQEVTSGDSSEYLNLTDISFEAAVKRGLRKMPQGATVT